MELNSLSGNQTHIFTVSKNKTLKLSNRGHDRRSKSASFSAMPYSGSHINQLKRNCQLPTFTVATCAVKFIFEKPGRTIRCLEIRCLCLTFQLKVDFKC